MSRQLKPNQWIYYFNLSQTNNVNYIMDHFIDLNFNHLVKLRDENNQCLELIIP